MLSAFQVHNGLAPKQLPRAMRYLIDLSTAVSVELDLATEQGESQLEFVQSLWVDNSNSPRRLDIAVQGVPQTIKIPIGAIACLPIICPGVPRFTFSVSVVTPLPIPILFLNVPMAHIVYLPGAA
jgi:hypothetical protein